MTTNLWVTGTVTLDAESAMFLVAGHLDRLDVESPDPDDGCCPVCCGPCKALKRLLDAGQLDDIARPYAVGGWDWWDAANGRVDRARLARAWRQTGCHDDDPAGVVDERDDDLYRQVVEEMDDPNRLADRIVEVVAEFGPAGVWRPTILGRVLAPGEPHGKLYVALVGALEVGRVELVPGSAPEGRYRVPPR